jgi:uncharacterized protein
MPLSLSASRLNDFLGCPHQAALWLAGEKSDAAVDPMLELVRERGFQHEAAVLKHLEDKHGPAVKIDSKGPLAERMAATLAAIKAGEPLIYQAALEWEGWIGFPDFLVRHDRAGVVTYEPEDAKLARKAKAEHVLQLGLYAELFERLTGMPVGGGAVHVAMGPAVAVDLTRTQFILKRLMRKFELFAGADDRQTRPTPCAACAQCDYKVRCEAEWRAADSPHFVAGVTNDQIVKLSQAGVTTATQLANLSEGVSVAGIGDPVLRKISGQARLQLAARQTGRHAVQVMPAEPGRGFHLLPPPDEGDLYFDIEGDPLHEGGLEYLLGLWGRLKPGAEPEFSALWAHDHTAEKTAFEQLMRTFIQHLAQHPRAHIYHYAQYEPVALKRLAMRYATMEAELDQMLRERRFVDLYRVARQGLQASTEGYSLKDLEKIYWGQRSGEVVSAGASVVEYENWRVTGESGILDAIAAYNRDDCVSTARMHLWLEGLRPAGCVYGVAKEATGDRAQNTDQRAALEANKQALAARVRASTFGDAALRDAIAELLWFHQRAQKPGWWAVFERQTWSDDELVDDAESLGGLRRDPAVAPKADKKSLLTSFRFTPQDTKLKVGDTPKIALTLAGAGTIVEAAPEDGRLVLRRAAAAGAYPDLFSLIPAPIDQRDLPVAVMAFAARFADEHLAKDAALMDFLMRLSPRFASRQRGLPVLDPGEDLLAGAIRAVADLDDSYLFIQGPPGTGKTFTIAAVIVDLLKRGKRVGVSSNSHKAINKVLADVETRARKAGYAFRGAKKGTKDDPETYFDSAHIATVFKSEDVGGGHQLVGGTAFHFCRTDQQGQYDYLVVDEAGQVALGNLVAMAGAARNLVLVGDQMQLAQPIQGVHPGETGLSGLDYLLQGLATVPPDRGLLLNESRRMRPEICDFISSAIYDGRLKAHPDTLKRELLLDRNSHPALRSAGLVLHAVEHAGRTQSNAIEADEIARIVASLLLQKLKRDDGTTSALTLDDVVVVAPYNMQVNLLKQRLPTGTRVGTVDKFQGQEAAVVILSMTTSRGEDAPRGTDFLFNANRFNVAVSRAQCLAIVVHGVDLLEGGWRRIEDLRRLNLFAQAEAAAMRTSATAAGGQE